MAKQQTAEQIRNAIRAKLGAATLNWKPAGYIDTHIPELNRVLGHEQLGVPWGQIMEIFGLESHGKTAITMALAAVAQRSGGGVVWGDFENSYKPDWAAKRGLNVDEVGLVQPYIATFGTEKKPRLANAEELCAEMEAWIDEQYKKYGKVFAVIDSIPAMMTDMEASAGLGERNMRTNMELPMFIGGLLRRWIAMTMTHNMTLVMINQLRQSPNAHFGDGWYTPGGNAPRFYAHVRVRVSRVLGSKITDGGQQVGIKGFMRAIKNKAGGKENSEVGYKLWYDGPIEFVDVKTVKSEDSVFDKGKKKKR